MTANTVVMITGANRGLGKALLEHYLSKPNHIVIAAVRDPNHATSKALLSLPNKGSQSFVILVKIDATNPTDPAEAVQTLRSQHGITSLDMVICNAGISNIWPKVSELDVQDMHRHMVPNVYGLVWLYQATLPLLRTGGNGGSSSSSSKSLPKWVTMGSSAGTPSMFDILTMPNAAYGPSKAVAHWLTAKMHSEEEGLISITMDPGWVQTDMGNYGAVALGFEKAQITTDESVSGMLKVIDRATRDETSGKFWNWKEEQILW